jgi:predicted regulator of Ras-like GTPase activity (Roadblock/LC7/MglB family)
VDAARALADLTEISPQVEAAVIFDDDGAVEASTLTDEERSREIARLGRLLFQDAGAIRSESSSALTQLQVQLRAGSVFVVREGVHSIAATTGEEPTVGLVFYDLRSALRGVGEPDEEGNSAA